MALYKKYFVNTLGVPGNNLYFDPFLIFSPYIMAFGSDKEIFKSILLPCKAFL